MSRRAAALAASLTIANMVASENGSGFAPTLSPAQPALTIQSTSISASTGDEAQRQAEKTAEEKEKDKEKKAKGLFKPPPYPPSMLKPRANVPAPTPSTAADPSAVSLIRADNEDGQAISPVSTSSSASEPPLAQRVEVNGAGDASSSSGATTTAALAAGNGAPPHSSSNSNHAKPPASGSSSPVPPVPTASPVKAEPPVSSSGAAGPSSCSAPPAPSSPTKPTAPTGAPSSPQKTWPPQWLSSALAAMQARYPNDKFEVILREVTASSTPEWRIKCLDCPGELYTPGPGETLSNYDVHLKDQQHRQRVNERLAAAQAAAAVPGSANNSTDAGADARS